MASIEQPRFAGEAVPYTYLGDSHAGTIGTLVFDDPCCGKQIVTRVSSIWRFVASDFLGEDGMIGDALMQALRRAGAFQSDPEFAQIPGLRPVLTTYGRENRVEQLALTAGANERPYVLCVGEINARYLLHRLAVDQIDFEVPFPTDGLERLPPFASRQLLRADQMLKILVEEFSGLIRGIRILREAGLRTVFLHALPPPTIDDADAARVYQHPSSARLRYKLTMFVNYLYDLVCRDTGAGYINTWPMVTEGNLLHSDYYLDGLHLNRRHAILSVTEVHRQLFSLRAPVAESAAAGLHT
jgi:hypothetical protein